MDDECRYCGSGRVVPVLDKRIERAPTAGNKFRARCLHCARWLPMVSSETFRGHFRPHVLPADADPEHPDSLIPLEDYDYGPEWGDLVEDVTGQRPNAVATDGGALTIDPTDDVSSDPDAPAPDALEDDDQDQDVVDADQDAGDDPTDDSLFECPYTGCSASNAGEPDECQECGRPYLW